MAGIIELAPDAIWSAAGWMLRRVLRAMATESGDDNLTATLHEIVEENLPGLFLPDLPPKQRAEAERVIRDRLMDRMEQDTPPDVLNRRENLDFVRTLPEMLTRATPH